MLYDADSKIRSKPGGRTAEDNPLSAQPNPRTSKAGELNPSEPTPPTILDEGGTNGE